MKKNYLLLCISLFVSALWTSLRAADGLPLTESQPTVEQDFNSMWDATASAATLAMPTGWRIDRQMDAPRTLNSFASAATTVMYSGGVSLASNASNGTWNFGSSSNQADRAVGGLSTTVANGTRCVSIMTQLSNTDAKDIESLSISYDIEKYRNGDNSAGFIVQMYYSTDGTAWTSAGSDFATTFAPDAATAGAAEVPISTTAVSNKLLKTAIAAGGDIYLAWNISVASGTSPNKAMGLALDNVKITATYADPSSQKHYIYVENAAKYKSVYVYANGADEPFGSFPGKASEGNSVVNGVEYKFFGIDKAGDYTLTFSDGTESNKIEGFAVNTSADVYVCISPEGAKTISDPASYTGWVDPSRPPFVASGIYLRGDVNSWGASSDWEFSAEGEGTYVLYDKTLNGAFKVADANWSSTCNYGSNGGAVMMDTPYALVLGTNDNISTGSNTFQCGKIVLTISNGNATLLLQSKEDDSDITSVYIIGDNNSWNYMDTTGELKLDTGDNLFKGQVSMAGSSDGYCHWRIYERLGMSGAWGAQGGSDLSGNITSGTLEKGSTGNVSTEAGTYNVTFDLATGNFQMEKIGTVIQSVTLMPANVTLVPTLPEKVKILSLNNSLIHYSDQPAMFNDIAAAMGKDASWTKHTRLGKSLNYHWEEGDGLAEDGTPGAKMMVRSDAWSHIILQEQSSLPRTDVETFRASVKKWVDYIREYCPNPNAIIIVPMNWAYSGDWTNFTAYNNTFLKNYQSVARELGVTLCPVARAYQSVYDKEGVEGISSWFLDDRHPVDMSAYMAACMEYGLIFGEDPTTISTHPATITDEQAAKMRSYASEALKNFSNYVDHSAGKVKLTAVTLDQFGMEIEAPADLDYSIDNDGTLQDKTTFVSNGTEGTYTVTAQNAQFTTKSVIKVAQAETEVPVYTSIELNEEKLTAEENFNSLGLVAEATIPEGWRIDRQTVDPRTVGTYPVAVEKTMYAGGASLPSNAKNGLWNFGKDNDDDRAVGGITTGVENGTRCINVYAHFFNSGRKDLENVTISYDVEKYRKGSNSGGFAVQLYYSVDGRNWTSAGSDFYTKFDPDDKTEGYADVPGEVVNVSKTLNAKIQHGCDFYLAWNISAASGDNCASAMALSIDNFKLEAQLPEIPTAKHYIYAIDETGYDALGLYAWGDSELFGTWPGETWVDQVTIGGETYKVFLLDAESGSYNLIFNNMNQGSQLPDYAITANRDYYFRLTSSGVQEVTPGEELTDYTVKFVNIAGWENVNVHAWNGDGYTTAWPGVACTKTGTINIFGTEADVYSATVSAPSAPTNVIFNDGTTQTEGNLWVEGATYSYDSSVGGYFLFTDDASQFLPASDITTTTFASYARKYTVGNVSTAVLPFDITDAELAATLGTFYLISDVKNGYVHGTPVATPQAYIPYVFVPAKEYPFTNLSVTGLPMYVNNKVEADGFTFEYVTESTQLTSGGDYDYYGFSNGQFVKAAVATANPFRAFLKVPHSAGAPATLLWTDSETGISSLKADLQNGDNKVYDLQGRRVVNPVRGIYVINGKKTVVK